MAALTIAQMLAAGVNPGLTDTASFPGGVVMEYTIDGSKRAVGATDTVEFYTVPTGASLLILGASVYVDTAATTNANFDLGIWASSHTNITGLTAFDLDAAAGTNVHKAATAANVAASGNRLTLEMDTAALGNGVIRIRVYGVLMA
jgi:hypothetical protein